MRKSALWEWLYSLQTEGQSIAMQLVVAFYNRFVKALKSCLRTSQNNTLSSLHCARSLIMFPSRPACITSPVASLRRYVWVALQICARLLGIHNEAFWGHSAVSSQWIPKLPEICRLHYQGSDCDFGDFVTLTHPEISKLYPPNNFRFFFFVSSIQGNFKL